MLRLCIGKKTGECQRSNDYKFRDWHFNLRWLPTVTVQLNIDQSLRYQNDLAFRFLMLKTSLKIFENQFCVCEPRN